MNEQLYIDNKMNEAMIALLDLKDALEIKLTLGGFEVDLKPIRDQINTIGNILSDMHMLNASLSE